jgi:conjugation system TraG family ATPase
MRVDFEDVFPCEELSGNAIINKYGDMALCFAYEGKEVFSSDKNGFINTHNLHDTAFNFLDESYVLHQQFITTEAVYEPSPLEFATYMSKANRRHFEGKRYFKTQSFVYIIKTDVYSIRRDSSTTRVPGAKAKRITFDIIEFENTVSEYVAQLKSGGINLVSLDSDFVVNNLLEGYFSFFQTGLLSDIEFRPLKIGDNFGAIFSLNDVDNQPDTVFPFSENKEYSTETNKVYSDYLYNLSFGLKCEHILNVCFFLDGQRFWKDQLEKRSKSLLSMSSFSSDNAKKAKDNSKFLEVSVDSDGTKKWLRVHMNCIFWAKSEEELRRLKGVVKGCFIDKGMKPHEANYLDLKNVFFASSPGNAGTMPAEETFLTHSDIASCYLIRESVYDRSQGKPSVNGLQFVDRVSGIPMFRDIWFEPYRTKQIDNRNGIVVGKSGGGKSATVTEALIRQNLEMGFYITAIDIGRSFELVVREYEGNYIVYQPGMSLGINPFELVDNVLSVDHLEYLATFIFILWKPKEVLELEQRQVLEKVILEYYRAVRSSDSSYIAQAVGKRDIGTFYNWVIDNRETLNVITRNRVDFFDCDSFIVVLEQFVTGKFSNLFVLKQGEKLIDPKKRLTVFELDNIKDHPTLFPIFSMLISYMSTNVLWGVHSSAGKIFLYDEAHKILEKPGMATNLRYQYKTYRKFGAAVWICIQQISDIDIPGTNIEESIRGNSDLKWIMRHAPDLVDELVERLKLSEHQKSLLMSIQNNLTGKYAYTEHLNIIGNDSKIVRTMVSPEQRVLLISETEDKKELYKIVDDMGNWHSSIEKYIKLKGWVK